MRQCVLIFFLLSAVMSAQDTHVRSVIIAGFSKNKIAVGADSREIATGSGSGYRDDVCKILALNGDFVFTATGKSGHISGGHPEFTWDIFTIAREIANRDKGASIEQIAQDWGERVAAFDNLDVKRGVFAADSSQGQTGFFVGLLEKRPILVVVLVTRSTSGQFNSDTSTPDIISGKAFPSGAIDIVSEYSALQTPRSRAWRQEFSMNYPADPTADSTIAPLIAQMIHLTIGYSVQKENVGYPIDLLELDSTGIHWLNRKTNCADN